MLDAMTAGCAGQRQGMGMGVASDNGTMMVTSRAVEWSGVE